MDLRRAVVVILDHEQKILFSSAGIHEVFRDFPGLRTDDGRWVGSIPAEGELSELDGISPDSRVRMVKTWISNGRPGVGYTGVVICPLGTKPEVRRSKMMDTFSFTQAELKLAELVIQGVRPQAAAVELGITVHTVRTYLKRLYRKAGVRSLSGLICVLNKALE